MKTQAFPFREIYPNTYEIGEFDCACRACRIVMIATTTGITTSTHWASPWAMMSCRMPSAPANRFWMARHM